MELIYLKVQKIKQSNKMCFDKRVIDNAYFNESRYDKINFVPKTDGIRTHLLLAFLYVCDII